MLCVRASAQAEITVRNTEAGCVTGKAACVWRTELAKLLSTQESKGRNDMEDDSKGRSWLHEMPVCP